MADWGRKLNKKSIDERLPELDEDVGVKPKDQKVVSILLIKKSFNPD